MSELTFEQLLEKYPQGLPPGFVVEKKFFSGIDVVEGSNDGEDDVTPPPPPPQTPVEPLRDVSFKDTTNNMVPSFMDADVNTNKCLFFERNVLSEGVPPLGYNNTPRETDPIQREASWRNRFREWAWLPRQMAVRASGAQYSFPDVSTSGVNLAAKAGMWVKREAIQTPTDTAWIDRLVAYAMRTDR